jgi:uncharacterized integral membrane protein
MSDEEREHVGRSTLDTIRIVLAVLIGVALGAFAVDNRDKTKVHYLFGDTQAPLIVVLVVAAVAGALIAALLRRHH